MRALQSMPVCKPSSRSLNRPRLRSTGYAEGTRLLLDAARQSRLTARGALSSVLDVPAELETAITAALGDSLDAILVSSSSIEDAITLLEQGRGACSDPAFGWEPTSSHNYSAPD